MSSGDPPTVLVVDDEPDVADAYAEQVSAEYHVLTAYSGGEALEKLTPAIDVMLLDRRMPDVSGDDVLEEMRDAGYECRVAMVTAIDPDFDIIEMPFDDYVTKPVSRADLTETIERLLVCAEYESKIRTYYALSRKYAALVANKSKATLEDNEEFAALDDRRAAVRAELDETVEQFDDEDFQAVFRELRTEESLRPGSTEL